MATAVETQRLISVSLGKIARSRSQRGGINLHKNLLVASVLNKARTAFMMENYNYQLSQQQKQQVIETPQPAPVSVPLPVAESGSSLPTHVAETCPTTPDAESRSATIDTQAMPELVNGGESCAISTTNDNMTTESFCDKENISPIYTDDSVISTPVSEIVEQQQCASGDQHIEAANQLSHDAQLAASNSNQNTPSYITLSPCKQLSSSASTTCAGVLKRRRVNLEAIHTSSTESSDWPPSKKPRVASSEHSQNSLHSQQSCDQISKSCEYESDSCESDMQTSDSPQISNLVSIFNSGFSGLCNVSSTSSSSSQSQSSSSDYNSCSYQPENSDYSSSVSHQSWSNSDNQSLHCSSMVERIGSISSAIVLSA